MRSGGGLGHLRTSERERAKKYWKQFYQEFTDYLYDDLGHFDNYVGQTIKNIRVFMNYLNMEAMLNIGTFHKQFHIPKEDIQIVVLSPDQLNYLIFDNDLNTRLTAELRKVKDIFIIGCTVALRFSDIMNLKPFQVQKQGDATYLNVRSQKTNVDTSIKLPRYAIDILQQYSGKKKTVVPKMSKGYLNEQLKRLAGFVVQDEPMIKVRTQRGRPVQVFKDKKEKRPYSLADHITTHTMRRTAITTMLRLGMTEEAVRKISGHAAGSKEFFKYIAFSQKLQDLETDKVFEKLENLI